MDVRVVNFMPIRDVDKLNGRYATADDMNEFFPLKIQKYTETTDRY